MNTQGDLPTLAEVSVPGFDVISCYGIYAPAGLPREMVMKLNSAFNAALHPPGIRDRMTTGDCTAVGGTAERFAAHTRTKVERRARVVESANVRVDSVSFSARGRGN